MKLAKEKIKSIGLGITAGLAGIALSEYIFICFGAITMDAAIPVFTGVAIIIGTAHYWKTLHIKTMHDEFKQVKNHLALLGNSIAETQGLVQLSGLNQPYPMPFGGSWALTPDAAAILASEIAIRRPNTIIELGSGVSTVMVGRLLKQMGCGRLVSLDHDPGWAEETRRTSWPTSCRTMLRCWMHPWSSNNSMVRILSGTRYLNRYDRSNKSTCSRLTAPRRQQMLRCWPDILPYLPSTTSSPNTPSYTLMTQSAIRNRI